MSHRCADWEPFAFQSPAEYARFVEWLEARVDDGTAENVAVRAGFKGANPEWERWVRCLETGELWTVVYPDGPSSGGFDRVAGTP